MDEVLFSTGSGPKGLEVGSLVSVESIQIRTGPKPRDDCYSSVPSREEGRTGG